ncbi:MAG: hypothetical protein R2800_11190 [Flavipsychrobacter sp.]
MVTNSSEKVSSTTPFNASFWNAKRWFAFLSAMLVLWVAVYLYAHSSAGYSGSEYVSFNKVQIRQLNTILRGSSSTLPLANTEDNISKADEDLQQEDYPLSESTTAPQQYKDNSEVATTCDLNCRTEKALLYVNSEFEQEVSEGQLELLKDYIKTFGPSDVGIFLTDYKLKVKSYFWLTGMLAYVEIVFWVIIGVICSLLFSLGNAVRKQGENGRGFNPNDIIYHIAKIFYAPFSAIIIVLAYSYFRNNTTLNIDANEGVIVFAFIAGLYSGRVMGFLDKVKQLLLPGTNGAQKEEIKYVQPAISPVVEQPVVKQMTPTTVAPKQEVVAEKVITDRDILEEMNKDYTPQPVEKKKGDDAEIEEVDIDLKLDFSGLFDDEKNELQQKGFSKAIVTLHNVNGKDIIPARKHDDDTSTFVASDVKPGIYIARATLSQRLKDDHIINLFGEKTAYVTIDKPGLELFVKKYESVE